jgi:gamma-glutamylcyclotransferase (GGCT)/AIG2-like uncharacterized protein YtfP
MDGTCRVFVYGTLKPGEYYYLDYCAPTVMAVQSAWVWGTLYHLPMGYPALTPGDRPIQGTLLTFPTATILQSLDELEGYDPQGALEENEYIRRLTDIWQGDRTALGQAWVYWMDDAQVQQWGGVLCEGNVWSRARWGVSSHAMEHHGP